MGTQKICGPRKLASVRTTLTWAIVGAAEEREEAITWNKAVGQAKEMLASVRDGIAVGVCQDVDVEDLLQQVKVKPVEVGGE